MSIPNKTKRFLSNLALVVCSSLICLFVVEAGARYYLYNKYMGAKFPMVVTHQRKSQTAGPAEPTLSWMQPDIAAYYWKVDESSRITFKTEYYSNNLGLISRHNQNRLRTGAEYRIAIVGDSFTAALQMPIPWTDILADHLNADEALKKKFNGATFIVYNFGQPAGGFLDFRKLAQSAKKLDPDLTIVNYIEGDFGRCNNCFEEDSEAEEQPRNSLVSGTIAIPMAGETEVPIVSVTCEQPPVSFSNVTCRHSFNLDAPPSIVEDPAKLKVLKQKLVSEFLQGQLFFSAHLYSLQLALGKQVSLTELRKPDISKPVKVKTPKSLSPQESIAMASSAIHDIASEHKQVLVTRNPTVDDFLSGVSRKTTDSLAQSLGKVGIEDMMRHMPKVSHEEVNTWYCVPYDTHMSQKGGYVYAQAMFDYIKGVLLSGK